MACILPFRALWPGTLRGLFHSIGAVLSHLQWPALWSGVISALAADQGRFRLRSHRNTSALISEHPAARRRRWVPSERPCSVSQSTSFQIFTVSSALPEASSFPSALKATLLMVFVCPLSVRNSFPLTASHNLTVPSAWPLPEAS